MFNIKCFNQLTKHYNKTAQAKLIIHTGIINTQVHFMNIRQGVIIIIVNWKINIEVFLMKVNVVKN
jgi:hypothetical protein